MIFYNNWAHFIQRRLVFWIMKSFASFLIAIALNVGFHEVKVDCSAGVEIQRITKIYHFVETFTVSEPTNLQLTVFWPCRTQSLRNPCNMNWNYWNYQLDSLLIQRRRFNEIGHGLIYLHNFYIYQIAGVAYDIIRALAKPGSTLKLTVKMFSVQLIQMWTDILSWILFQFDVQLLECYDM